MGYDSQNISMVLLFAARIPDVGSVMVAPEVTRKRNVNHLIPSLLRMVDWNAPSEGAFRNLEPITRSEPVSISCIRAGI